MWSLLLLACSTKTEPAVCPPPATWEDLVLTDKAADVGLEGVRGTRLTAVDFNGDGWPDLSVAGGLDAADDFGPDGVRATWLLRNDQGRFVDVTESSGFRQRREGRGGRLGNVVAWGDVDNDGDLDAWTGAQDPTGAAADTSELLLNNGDGTFRLAEGGTHRLRDGGVPAAAVWVDVDRDGILDLWLPQGNVSGVPQQDRLLLGAPDLDFTDVTDARGLTTRPWSSYVDLNTARAHSNAWSGVACDVNADGRPDLLAASYGRAPNHLWMQGEDGTFANLSLTSNYAFDHRTDWSDNESARCWCELHPADLECAGVPASAFVCEDDDDAFRWDHDTDRMAYRLGGNSGTTVCADVDNDQDLDLITTEIVHWDVGSSSDPSELLLNDGAGVFTRPGSDVTGLVPDHTVSGWNDGDITAAAFDLDNDGWQEILINSTDYEGTRARIYHQVAPGQFELMPPRFMDAPRAHGVAVADFDRDGDVDLIIGTSLNRCADDCPPDADLRYFENPAGGASLQLELVGGPGSNRAAIGARITVKADGVTQTRVVDGGHGHYGLQHDLVQTIGLGAACAATVTVTWPDATGTTSSWELTPGAWRLEPGAAPQPR